MEKVKKLLPALLAVALIALCAGAYAQIVPAPNADQDAMYKHFKKAEQIAGLDLYPHFAHACIIDQHYRTTISRGSQATGDIPPEKVFDNTYYVGQNAVNSWAIKTSEGIIIIDTLNSPDEAKKYIVGGLEKLGLKPADIKYVVLSHSHGDHTAGANYLKATYGARLICSKADWDELAKQKAAATARPPAPAKAGETVRPSSLAENIPVQDIVVTDGQKFTLGDTTINFYITPGHSPGLLSMTWKVTDNGQPHMAALFGGLGMPADIENKRLMDQSVLKFKKIAAADGVDTLLGAHRTRDASLWSLEINRIRRAGDPNPFVIGKEGYQRYMDIQDECIQYAAAREGQKF